MATLTQIETAFGQHLVTPAISPVVEPNKAASPANPFITIAHYPVSRDSRAIDGNGGTVSRGYFICTVVAASNTFSTVANGKADEIAARFPVGLKLAVGARFMRISRPPSPAQGFPDGADWRQPVRIDYIVTAK
jgi:hypothetical protein